MQKIDKMAIRLLSFVIENSILQLKIVGHSNSKEMRGFP